VDRIIAYCGIVCSECDAYLATRANDLETLARLAQRAQDEFGVEGATAETMLCDGCLADDGRQIGYCATCEIRACAVERGVANCAHCTDYVCEKLEGFLVQATEARTVLDEIRQSL
jgi:hypothetical protein